MTLLEKIVYIADYIEPNRKEIPGLAQIRKIVFTDIDRAVCLSAGSTVRYLKNGGKAVAAFEGLKDYTDGEQKTYKSYWIVETKAPEGYNLLSAPVKVDFTAENSTADTDYTVTVQVKNTTGFTLPKTGDIGTILFTVAGVGLIGAAVILLVASKKRKNEAE